MRHCAIGGCGHDTKGRHVNTFGRRNCSLVADGKEDGMSQFFVLDGLTASNRRSDTPRSFLEAV